ncbi:C-Jun-amino-terminal kinase-interacting protein 4 [Liparis tanakae]|uniref:C-Jun-amino-terminal kinase-interacting protein 4 n=1 Tax=Liparis tanakae TaxID=230148 RepID=A0A4Z2G4Y1_9TELE|nr:C-Jun-amino-terminal kinase-interacting protein 4 [Liparis tanakae]
MVTVAPQSEAGVRRRGTDPSHITPSHRGFHTVHSAGANSRGSIFTKLPPLSPRLHPQTYIALEDAQDGEKKDLQCRLTVLESHTRQLELKTKNYADQIGRLDEREAELKKEYNGLHQRHTEMIHSYMEHLERTKHQHTATAAESSEAGVPVRTRKERPISMGIFQLPGTDGVTSDLAKEPVDASSESWRFNNVGHPRSNASLKFEEHSSPVREEGQCSDREAAGGQDEMSSFSRAGSKSSTPTKQGNVSKAGTSQGGGSRSNTATPSQGATPQSNTHTSAHGTNSQATVPPSPCGGASAGMSPASVLGGGGPASVTASVTAPSTAAGDVAAGSTEQEVSGLNGKLDQSGGKQESSKNMAAAAQEGQQSRLGPDDEADNREKSEVQAIIESTPELDMDLDGFRGASTPTKGGIENLAFDRNTDSLFAELSSAGDDLIGDVDEGADMLGMGREVEHLIHENAQLLETKNALNVVKNDLIAQMDELSCEQEVLRSELEAVTQAKSRLEDKNRELEDDLKKMRAQLEDATHKVKNDNEDDSDVPTAQRKRFTRVEMARVLMERNQYKERLMELQEAVRWTEMIRASKENPALPEKKKSSMWQFSSGAAAKKPALEAPVNVKYNAPTAHLQPSVKKRSTTLQQLPSDKSKAFDFLNEEVAADNVVSRREQKRAQYQQVKAHVQKEDGRVQAYGWSLPKKYKANGGQTESKAKNLPVPVFLRPLDEKDASMKLWCAAGVNLSGGKTRDGGSIVGASEELRQHDEMSSLVWICTSTESTTKAVVVDANQAGNILEGFFVCDSHVLCIASARETDYPAGEEVAPSAEAGPAEDGSSPSAESSVVRGDDDGGGGGGVLGGITVVGCDAEGAAAVPQTAVGLGEDGERASRPAEEATEATEATEASAGPADQRGSLRGVYTEHVFTDPLRAQPTAEAPANYSQRESDLLKDGVSSDPDAEQQDLMREEAQKMSSVLPTMWLGAQNGCVYVHSSVAQWKKCLHSIKLKDAVLGIVHVKGRVLVGLADGTLAIFHRGVDGQWDLTNYHLLDLGRPHHAIRCMTIVHDKVWCGYRNKIHVVQPKAMRIEKSFDAHPRKDSQVRQLAWDGDGIWVSIRLDSTLRLFHAHTFQHLQDVDIEPYVSKMLGTGKLGFSFVRITALMVSSNRLWIGTGNGVILSIPLTETANKVTKAAASDLPGGVVRVYGDDRSDKVTAGTFVPYCSMAHAQLCFHGHRDAVKFFTAVPGHAVPPASCGGEAPGDKATDGAAQDGAKSVLVMSGGEGYIDFRMGDEDGEAEEGEQPPMKLQPSPGKAERSHLIVWQVLGSED